MKILFAADGSKCTKKALGFVVTHEGMVSGEGELVVLNVQPALPPHVKRMLDADTVASYHQDEADKVLAPIRKFLDRHALRYRCIQVIGSPAAEIVKASQREKAHLVVMGTHGHGVIGRTLLGSVAQRVVAECDVPVLLVK